MGALIILSFYLAYLLILLSLKYFNARLRIEKLQEPSSLGLIMLAFFASFTLFFLPASNAFSRYQEKQADLCSVCLTRNKEAIISALKKLYHFNGIDPEPGVIIKIFFEDHPSLQERINYIESFLLPKANNKQ
jgi:Zn-dependent protease with chaperone function